MGCRDMRAFAALGSDRVGGVMEALGAAMAPDPVGGGAADDLERMGLSREQARDMIGWFRDFCIGASNPGLMVSMMESADAGEDAKKIAIGAFQSMVEGRTRGKAHEIDAVRGPADANFAGYRRFVRLHRDDPELKGKYVAFVHGKYQKCGTAEGELVREMREKFGNANMAVGPVSGNLRTVEIKTPRLI